MSDQEIEKPPVEKLKTINNSEQNEDSESNPNSEQNEDSMPASDSEENEDSGSNPTLEENENFVSNAHNGDGASGAGDSVDTDDDDMDGLFDSSELLDDSSSGTREHCSVSVKYKAMNQSELRELMEQKIVGIIEVLHEDKQVARALLASYKWNDSRLLEDFYSEGKGKEYCCELAGIGLVSPNDLDNTNTCCICYDEEGPTTKLDCSHNVCNNCFQSYVMDEVVNKRMSSIQCPQCCVPLNELHVLQVLGSQSDEFEKNLVDNFVQTNPKIKWCPSPDSICGRAIISNVPGALYSVLCTCTKPFCFNCLGYDHQPLSCSLLEEWTKKRMNDADHIWIFKNAKKCPQCSASIEKNGGCNHMTCRGCKHEFCWICMSANWRNCNCNRFRGDEAPESSNRTEAERDMERYLFYLERYDTHEHSLLMENKLDAFVLNKVDHIGATSEILVKGDFAFLLEALTTLKSARQTLVSTFAYAYYLKPCCQLDIFEDNQGKLQSGTEKLSGLLESEQLEWYNMDHEKLNPYKSKVIEAMTYCKNRRDVLLCHAAEGTLELDIPTSPASSP